MGCRSVLRSTPGRVALALAVSFAVVAAFARRASLPTTAPTISSPALESRRQSLLSRALRVAWVGLLLPTIPTGLFGSQDSFTNFSMTFFWIVFVLGVTYAVALVGDFYAIANPWRALREAVERLRPGAFAGRIVAPRKWGDWPALLLYIGCICVELFAHSTPQFLGAALLVYTAINFLGAALLGKETWFRHGEFFAVFRHWIGAIAPLARALSAAARRVRLRTPFVGLLNERVLHTSGVHKNDTVSLSVTSDEADELHLHGHDLHARLVPGQAARLEFVARRTGRFTLELHRAGLELGAVEIYP